MSDTQVVQVGPKGRIVIPAEMRRTLDLDEGSELVAFVDDGAVVLIPRASIKRRLRSLFADADTSLRDELIADRRSAAAQESRAT
jgi:AbrB family looped-hinge helix DNA binding protein